MYRVWTPVFGKDDQQTTDEDDDEKHPSIIKNGVMETDLNVSCIRIYSGSGSDLFNNKSAVPEYYQY